MSGLAGATTRARTVFAAVVIAWNSPHGAAAQAIVDRGAHDATRLGGVTAASARSEVGSEASVPAWFRWGFQRPDLVRFNRVEGLSVGVRGAVLADVSGRALSVTATARVGTADRHPTLGIELERTSLARSISAGLYHELAATDPAGRYLDFGNSLWAVLGGRDDGDYFRRSGARLSLAPGPGPRVRPLFRIEVHSEYHEPVVNRTRISLARLWEQADWTFRPNVVASEGWEHALTVDVSPRWGGGPAGVRGGLHGTASGAVGDLAHARAKVTGDLTIPLGADIRLAVGAGAGVATSDAPPQRAHAVGGPRTLRGYPPRASVGPCGAHARAEVQRVFSFGGLGVWGDAGWAGSCQSLGAAGALESVGLGVSLADGIVRADLGRALDGSGRVRFDLYLDGTP
jgi:hypothetical protein